MQIVELLRRHHDALTPAERRVAEAIVADPEGVAFGTVASLAARATTGGATVLRLATKLELDGFSELQGMVRDELSHRLRPAVERIREPARGNPLAEARRVEQQNLAASLQQVDEDAFTASVAALADQTRSVAVVASAASRGLGLQVAFELASLRAGVERIEGNQVDVLRQAAHLPPESVVIAVDFHRYDSWLLEALSELHPSIELIAVTDSPISPLARRTELALVVAGEGVGPFDSWVGALAVLQALSAGVAAQLIDPATARLDDSERAWRRSGALRDD